MPSTNIHENAVVVLMHIPCKAVQGAICSLKTLVLFQMPLYTSPPSPTWPTAVSVRRWVSL